MQSMHVYSLLLLEHVRHPHFRSLLKHHWRTNLFRYLYKKKKKMRARAFVVLSRGSSGAESWTKKCLIESNVSSRKKIACICVGGEGRKKMKASDWKGKGRSEARDAILKDVRTRNVCVNPCSPYVLTALAYIATPLHCDHVYKEKNSLKARR